jgi:hypothetical protein
MSKADRAARSGESGRSASEKGTEMSIKSAIALEAASRKAQRETRDLEHEIRVLEQQVGRLALLPSRWWRSYATIWASRAK